jgi:hypothetical protein
MAQHRTKRGAAAGGPRVELRRIRNAAFQRIGRSAARTVGVRSTTESAVEERDEEVVSLTQRLMLHSAQVLNLVH